jgi:hypothetical protein
MSRISKAHEELDALGIGKCSCPMWQGGVPAGFCDEPAYGPQTTSPRIYNYPMMREQRYDGRYDGYVPALACPAHAGPRVRTFMDGDAWCAVRPNFIDLQVSDAGFGYTREAAIKALGVTP